jgi:dihydroorotate dehydrogenase (NAD+) catalytic subunit
MNMEVNIAGLSLKNPVVAASGTFGFGKEYGQFYDIAALGGICTKAITLHARNGNPPPRIAQTAGGILNSVGLQNPGIAAFLAQHAPFLEGIGSIIIANVAGNTEDDYVQCAMLAASSAAVDMVELNISCPNVKAGGMAFGIEPKSVERITSAVRRHCSKPLMVKLSPNTAYIADNARAAEAAGADAISLINTLTGMAIDLRRRRPVLGNVVGGLSGAAVKPVALKMVFDAYHAVKIPIMGIGGAMCAADVLEFMLAGAAAVQVGTATIYDPMAAFNIVQELPKLLSELQISDINSMVGALEV